MYQKKKKTKKINKHKKTKKKQKQWIECLISIEIGIRYGDLTILALKKQEIDRSQRNYSGFVSRVHATKKEIEKKHK